MNDLTACSARPVIAYNDAAQVEVYSCEACVSIAIIPEAGWVAER
jgi:hypothetical protein